MPNAVDKRRWLPLKLSSIWVVYVDIRSLFDVNRRHPFLVSSLVSFCLRFENRSVRAGGGGGRWGRRGGISRYAVPSLADCRPLTDGLQNPPTSRAMHGCPEQHVSFDALNLLEILELWKSFPGGFCGHVFSHSVVNRHRCSMLASTLFLVQFLSKVEA